LNLFHCKNKPAITIDLYLERLIKYSKIEDSTLVVTLMYIDRLCETKEIILNVYNIHRYVYKLLPLRIVFIAMLLAIKYNEDDIFTNEYYSKVAGISLPEVNSMEHLFLKLINFELFIENDYYNKYIDNLTHCDN
jgi:hypothetical protein